MFDQVFTDSVMEKTLGVFRYIDIHKLAHKCKEWVTKVKPWTLQSYTNYKGSGICRVQVGDGQTIHKETAVTEPEAIFKVAQWVLEGINELSYICNNNNSSTIPSTS